MYLNYCHVIQQLFSGLLANVVYSDLRVEGSKPTAHHFQIEETCTFMNISSLKYHLSVI